MEAKMSQAPSQDDVVRSLQERIAKEKEEIAQIKRGNFVTSCAFSFREGDRTQTINLHTENRVEVLIKIAAWVMRAERDYNEAAVALALRVSPAFTYDGYTVKDWLADLGTRIARIQVRDREAQLKKLEDRLAPLLSKEEQTRQELARIQAELG